MNHFSIFLLPKMNKLYTALVVAAVSILNTGCDKGLSTVNGTVTVDGNPVQQGAIIFEPADGQGPTAGTTIEAGKYEAKTTPGDKKVRITGFEIVGQQPAYKGMKDSPMRDVVNDVVPEQYNRDSNLTLTVEKSGTTGDFALDSKSEAKKKRSAR